MSSSFLNPHRVEPVLFPLHRVRRGPVVIREGRRGHVVTSRFEGGPKADAGTFTGFHDSHHHGPGPGYAPTQVGDFSGPLSEGVQDLLALLDAAGVERILWMPIPTNIEGGPGTHCCGEGLAQGRTYYLPDRFRDGRAPLTPAAFTEACTVGQYYNTSVDWQVAKAWKELPPAARERLHPAITGINLQDSNGIYAVMRLKKEYPGIFHWAGELTICKGAVQQQNRSYQPSFAADAPLHTHLDFLARAGLGTTLHCDVSDEAACIRTGAPGRAENLADIRSLFAAHPDNLLVWAHLGGLGRFGPPSRHHERDLAAVLRDFPNVNIDMSWSDVAAYYSPHPRPAANLSEAQRAAFDPEADRARRRHRIRRLAAVIEQYPERFLMGSDALVSRTPESISSSYGIYSNLGQGPGTTARAGGRAALFDFLSTDTQVAIQRGNFERLYGQARGSSLRYEAKGLQQDLDEVQRQALQGGRTPNRWKGDTPCS
jgi:hypothetical protein